jgi:hypothetical protein
VSRIVVIAEDDAMLEAFLEFDRAMTNNKYKAVVEKLE